MKAVRVTFRISGRILRITVTRGRSPIIGRLFSVCEDPSIEHRFLDDFQNDNRTDNVELTKEEFHSQNATYIYGTSSFFLNVRTREMNFRCPRPQKKNVFTRSDYTHEHLFREPRVERISQQCDNNVSETSFFSLSLSHSLILHPSFRV